MHTNWHFFQNQVGGKTVHILAKLPKKKKKKYNNTLLVMTQLCLCYVSQEKKFQSQFSLS